MNYDRLSQCCARSFFRPPKHNKDFIKEFSDFISAIRINYDRILIVGDFNVHVCCPSKPMAKDFLEFVHAFSFVQNVTGPTQMHGHTLDLVLSYGFPVNNVFVGDAVFSHHSPVMFDFNLNHYTKLPAPVRFGRFIKPDTASGFCPLFTSAQAQISPATSLDTEQLMEAFISTCTDVLDILASLKAMRPKTNEEPWLNDTTRAASRECRKAERRWKKDGLHVSYQILKDSWRIYQNIVKAEKTKYLSDIISNNINKPQSYHCTGSVTRNM